MVHIPIIAIDGVVASGKGTLAKRLAKHLHYGHLDTGKLYRAVSYLALENNTDTNDINALVALVDTITPEILTLPRLIHNDVGNMASAVVSRIQPVRDALLSYQRDFPKHCMKDGLGGAVVDGRDIGSVIFPDAGVKFFVVADAHVRAERRFQELQNTHNSPDYERVLSDLKIRDKRDTETQVGRLVQTPDSIVIDTTYLDADEVLSYALDIIEK